MAETNNIIDRILWSCRLINKATNEAIQILKESTLAHVRSIERSSRSIKDPNPLMSTMTNINLKYPITFRSEFLINHEVPKDLYFDSEDNRRYKRKLCRKEMVQWYIQDGPEPTNNIKDSIVKLFDASVNKFTKVFDYDWESTRFKIGNVSLSRMLVSVNPNKIDIPKELQKPAIMQSLGLSNMIEYSDVPDYYLEQIHKIVHDSNLNQRSIPNILNYIQAQIDKRYRYLPMLPGLTPDFVYISHALIQPQYRAVNIMTESSEHRGQNLSVTQTCMSLLGHIQENKLSLLQIREFVDQCTINDYPLKKLLATTDENKFTKFCKGLCGYPISPCIERAGIRYYPKPNKLFETTHTNLAGFEFKRLNGEETVFFETNLSKGFFVHNADALLNISITRSTLKNLSFVLLEIACFCTKRFEQTTALNVRMVREQIKRYYASRLFEIIGIENKYMKALPKIIEEEENDIEIGILRFSNSLEIESSEPTQVYLKDQALHSQNGNQLICVAPYITTIPKLEFNVKINNPLLYYLLNPKRFLAKSIQLNIQVIGKIRENIRNNIFSPTFPQFLVKYVPISQQRSINEYLKRELFQMVKNGSRNNVFISIFYNFTLGQYNEYIVDEPEYILFDQERIYLSLNRGMLIKDSNEILKCGDYEVLTCVPSRIETPIISQSLLPGFKIIKVQQLIRDIPIKSINWLSKNYNKLPEGFKAITIFQTGIFVVTKYSRNVIETIKTLERHITLPMEEDTSFRFQQFLMKRRLDDTDSSSTSGERKRQKIEDGSSIIS